MEPEVGLLVVSLWTAVSGGAVVVSFPVDCGGTWVVAGVGRVLVDRHLGVVCCCFRGECRSLSWALTASGYLCAFV